MAKSSRTTIVVLGLVAAGALLTAAVLPGCLVKDPLYCHLPEHPCSDPSRPYCDETGQYEPQNIANTCIASPFDAMPEGPQPDAAPKPASLTISEPSHDFHDAVMGVDSFPAQLIVTNEGDLPSGTIAVSIGGTNQASFVLVPTGDSSDCAGQQLGAGKTCIVQVKYHPGDPGAESGVLHVDSDPGGMPICPLAGRSLTQGALVLTTAPLDFGNLAIQSVSGAKTITIKNTGGVPCTNLAFAVNDASYTKTTTTCTTNLAASASCDFNVQFNPAAVGTRSSSVSINSDQAATAAQLQGTGTADIKVMRNGTGTVADTLASPIISCGNGCTGTYSTTPITLHAVTTGGIPFNNWTGVTGCGTSADCTIALTTPLTTVTATFGVCVPTTGACTNGNLTVCDSTGHMGAPTACPLGCYTDGTRCWDVDPTNGLAAALDDAPSGPSLVLSDGASFNTDNGNVVDGTSMPVTVPSVLVTQGSGYPTIRVFQVKSVQLGATQIVGSNAFGIVSDADVGILGELAVYGTDTTLGSGSGQCNSTNTGNGLYSFTPMGSTQFAGGGGATFGTSGWPGGSNGAVAGGLGGVDNGEQTLHPLRGGCYGGFVTQYSGGVFPNIIAVGGEPGGSVQIVSRTSIVVSVNGSHHGAINVGGGGGPSLGGGGASGGGVLLEAPLVVVTGIGAAVAANGGGGGGGCSSIGSHGLPSSTPAPGGACSTSMTTSGGAGAAGAVNATRVSFGLATNNGHAGGGGGGGGRIRINTASGGYTVSNGGVTSPQAFSGNVGKR